MGYDPAASPAPWVARFAPLAAPGGSVLDLACGGGRHGRLFLGRGHAVCFLDIDLAGVADLAGQIGRAACRERVCQYVSILVVTVALKKTNRTNKYTRIQEKTN